jgi:hypothetical protein
MRIDADIEHAYNLETLHNKHDLKENIILTIKDYIFI